LFRREIARRKTTFNTVAFIFGNRKRTEAGYGVIFGRHERATERVRGDSRYDLNTRRQRFGTSGAKRGRGWWLVVQRTELAERGNDAGCGCERKTFYANDECRK